MKLINGALANPLLSIAIFFFLSCLGCGIAAAWFSDSYNLTGGFSTAATVCLGLGFYIGMKADKNSM